MIVGCVVAGIVIKPQSDNIQEQTELLNYQKAQIDNLYNQLLQTNDLLEATALRADAAQQEAIKAKSEAIKNKAKLIKSQKNLQEMQTQMQELRDEMNSFYNGIINGENQ